MPRLLISVRDDDEAESALNGGADLIDIKEPARGALGHATSEVWCDVVSRIAGRRPVSCALGELHDDLIFQRAALAHGMTFAKAGLAHMRNRPDWHDRWFAVQQALPTGTSLVAAIYADWQHAGTPLPSEILDQCAASGCRWALIDTWNKSRRNVFTCMDQNELQEIVSRAKHLGMQIVLAGSLVLEDLARIASFDPEYVGIRSAACVGGRTGRICESLVRRLSSGVHGIPSTNLNCGKKPFSIA